MLLTSDSDSDVDIMYSDLSIIRRHDNKDVLRQDLNATIQLWSLGEHPR